MNENTGDNIEAPNAGWSFAGDAAANFDEHVRRSLPFYDESLDLVCRLSDYFLTEESRLYDLGCATGELLRRLSLRHGRLGGLSLTGLDREADMIAVAHEQITAFYFQKF